MKFTKIHGAGNDFIIINNMIEKLPPEVFGKLAKKLCARRLSIGADGLMVVDYPDGDADFKMRFYNSDGSVGEMCGNGARCIARYGYENKLAGEIQHIETTAGLVTGHRKDQRMYTVRLNDPSRIELNRTLVVENEIYEYAYVELGNPGIPHAVVRIKGLRNKDKKELFELGRAIRYHENFYKGCNVNFFDVVGEDDVIELTYERGVEYFTYACGTGTGSVIAVLTMLGEVSGKNVKTSVMGGQLYVSLDIKDGKPENIMLTGPTNIVAEGEVKDEDLDLGL